MAINPYASDYFYLRIKPDFIADTLLEVQLDLETYVGKYVQIIDQASKIYYVQRVCGTPVLNEAYDFTNYEAKPSEGETFVGFPLYIQDTQPVTTFPKYLWIQTNYQEPGGLTFWVEDAT